jgi:UDP-GlcNAc:undecaprenyl-phosphate/decaprenyl-phosphate GlcNAc-1-phosphate transferase
MRTFIVAFTLSLVFSLFLTPFIRNMAHRFKLVQAPEGGRNIHKKPIPRLGGIAILISMWVPLISMFLWNNDISTALRHDTSLLTSLVGGTLILGFIGVWDDLVGVRAIIKLLAQIGAALVIYFSGIHIDVITIPLMGVWDLGILDLPITVFWVVLVINAVNLIDGMDGLAGSVVAVAGFSLFVMGVMEDNILSALLLICMVGGCLGFLVYNLNPASIFLGDTGSMFLGFILATAAVHSSQKSYTVFSIVSAFIILGLPIFDLSLAVFRRFLSGQPLFSADQHHIHHMLLRRGWTQKQSVFILFSATVGLACVAFVSIYADDRMAALSILSLLPISFIVVKILGYSSIINSVRRTHLLEKTEQESDRRLSFLEDTAQRLEVISTIEELEKELENIAVQCQWRRLTLFSQTEVYFGYPKNQKHEIVLGSKSETPEDFEAYSSINEVTEPTIAKNSVHIQNLKEFRFTIPKREQNFYIEIEQLSEKQIFASMDKVLILYFAEIFRRARLSTIYLPQSQATKKSIRT